MSGGGFTHLHWPGLSMVPIAFPTTSIGVSATIHAHLLVTACRRYCQSLLQPTTAAATRLAPLPGCLQHRQRQPAPHRRRQLPPPRHQCWIKPPAWLWARQWWTLCGRSAAGLQQWATKALLWIGRVSRSSAAVLSSSTACGCCPCWTARSAPSPRLTANASWSLLAHTLTSVEPLSPSTSALRVLGLVCSVCSGQDTCHADVSVPVAGGLSPCRRCLHECHSAQEFRAHCVASALFWPYAAGASALWTLMGTATTTGRRQRQPAPATVRAPAPWRQRQQAALARAAAAECRLKHSTCTSLATAQRRLPRW